MSRAADLIISFATELIAEGVELQAKKHFRQMSSGGGYYWVDHQPFQKWRTSCKVLLSQLGSASQAWAAVLGNDASKSHLGIVDGMIGALESICENAKCGRLASFEDIVFAEAFVNLSEQATHLLSKGYALAAGVIYRAVLEERLRRLCDSSECPPAKDRPTIADYNRALYKAEAFDKVTMKSVDMMATVGNSAAHNDSSFKEADVPGLRDNLAGFLAKLA